MSGDKSLDTGSLLLYLKGEMKNNEQWEKLRQRALRAYCERGGDANPELPALLAEVDAYPGQPTPEVILKLARKYKEAPQVVEIAFEMREERLQRKGQLGSGRVFEARKTAWMRRWLPEEDAVLRPGLGFSRHVARRYMDEWLEKINNLPENRARGVVRTRDAVIARRAVLAGRKATWSGKSNKIGTA